MTSDPGMTKVLDLAELFNHYGSDKDRNGYAQAYHTLFGHLHDRPCDFLEIGIGTMLPNVIGSMVNFSLPNYRPGGSLRAWRDFLPQGRIWGVDIQPDTQFEEERIKTYLCNSTDHGDVERLVARMRQEHDPGLEFDVIIDDGSHWEDHQYQTLANFFPYVKSGGFYVIEDVNPGSKISAKPEALEPMVGRSPFFFVGIKNNICVIHKVKLNSQRFAY